MKSSNSTVRKEKKKLVRVELNHENGASFLSYRALIPMHCAGQILTVISQVPHIQLKPRMKKGDATTSKPKRSKKI